MIKAITRLMVFTVTVFMASVQAHAACTGPSGVAGAREWFDGTGASFDPEAANCTVNNGGAFSQAGSVYNTPDEAKDIWGDGTYLYVADLTGGVHAFSFNGSTFSLIDTVATTDANGIWGDGNYIYVADAPAGVRALSFDGVDLTIIDTYDTVGDAAKVWGDGTYIYVADWAGGVYALTFNGTSFTYIDRYDTPGQAMDVHSDGEYIYVADGTSGIRALTFNGSSFSSVATLGTSDTTRGVYAEGGYIYIADGTTGARALSFNGTAFSPIATYDTPDVAYGIWSDGVSIYVADDTYGIYALHFSGTAFSLQDNVDTPNWVTRVWGDGTYIYGVLDDNGIVAYSGFACTETDGGEPGYKLCNGTEWVNFYKSSPDGACSTAAATDYDTGDGAFKYCDGSGWNFISCNANSYTGTSGTSNYSAANDRWNNTDLACNNSARLLCMVDGNTVSSCTISTNDLTEDDAVTSGMPSNIAHIVSYGDYAFAIGEDRVFALDVSDPANVTLVDTQITTGDPGNGNAIGGANDTAAITSDGRYLLVVSDDNWSCAPCDPGGLMVIDISDPTNMAYVDNISDATAMQQAIGIDIQGNYAYVVGWEDGYVAVIDLSDIDTPANFNASDIVEYADTGGAAVDIDVRGDYAYTRSNWSGMRIMDVSDPTNVSQVGAETTVSDKGLTLDLRGDYVFVQSYDEEGGSTNTVEVVDISNKASPSRLSARTVNYGSGNFSPGHMSTIGDYLFVPVQTDGLYVYDISDLANDMPEVDNFTSANLTDGWSVVATAGQNVYAADYASSNVVSIDLGCGAGSPSPFFDVSAPNCEKTNEGPLSQIATYDTSGQAWAVWTDGTYYHVADGTAGFKAFTFDGTTFTPAGDDPWYAEDIWSDGTYIYIGSAGNGLRAYSYDGSDYTFIDDDDPGGNGLGVWGDGTYIYYGEDDGNIRAYTFNGSVLTQQGSAYDTGAGAIVEIWGDGTYIYSVADGDGVTAFTFNGSSFTELDNYNTSMNSRGVWGDGSYIYVADHTNGVKAFSFNGSNFTLLDTYNTTGEAWDIWYDGVNIFVADQGGGIVVLRFDGTSFEKYDHFQIPGVSHNIEGVSGDGEFIFAADSSDGIRALKGFECYGAPDTGSEEHFMVLSNASWSGDLGGLSGANSKCFSDLNANDWKGKSTISFSSANAFLCDGGSCQNPIASTTYEFANAGDATAGGATFTTNGSGLGPGDTTQWNGAAYFNETAAFWTGRTEGGSSTLWPDSSTANHCTGWTVSGSGAACQVSESCTTAGSIEYSSSTFYYCDGSNWHIMTEPESTCDTTPSTFTTPGTDSYTVPDGCNQITIEVYGAGGGGGGEDDFGGSNTDRYGGGGGGGGSVVERNSDSKLFIAAGGGGGGGASDEERDGDSGGGGGGYAVATFVVTPGTDFDLFIGGGGSGCSGTTSGGAGGAYNGAAAGSPGGNSTYGGGGGGHNGEAGGDSTYGGGGGAGDCANNSGSTTTYGGAGASGVCGSGGCGSSTNGGACNATYGGGGGGGYFIDAAGVATNGILGSAASTSTCNGGAAANGGPGTGGEGAGGNSNCASTCQAGGNGQIVITPGQ